MSSLDDISGHDGFGVYYAKDESLKNIFLTLYVLAGTVILCTASWLLIQTYPPIIDEFFKYLLSKQF